MNNIDFTLIITLLNIGFFGGFIHCTAMCGPFVLTQISSKLQKIPLEDYSFFKKISTFLLISYHLGRITTYSIIGVFCSIIGKNIKDFADFNKISGILMIFAALILAKNLFNIKILTRKSNDNKWLKSMFLKANFENGYVTGLILGFLPCGLLYSVFAISANISSPFLAFLALWIFGISTIPALFLTSYFGFKILNKIKFFAKIIIFINFLTLMTIGIITLVN